MFALDIAAVPYADPWNLSLEARLSMLGRGRQRIAYYYEAANNSTFRYRAYNMAQVLNHNTSGGVSASYFFATDLHRIDDIAQSGDVLVICRSGYNHHIAQLIAKFRLHGKRVLFDIDDFVFNTDYTHLIINTLGLVKADPLIWEQWFGMISRMGQTLRMCDGAITTNTFLAERIAEYANLPVGVVPNFINREQLELSGQVFDAKQASGFKRDDSICLGYFSGSPSHRLDYAIVESALESVLASDARTKVMVVGYIDAGPALAQFGDRVIRQPFHDYVNLQKLIGSVEINLMPLQANVFTDCKSELKYFEAAIVGTLSIASPSHSYASAIRHGENGYIARAHQWATVIQQAIGKLAQYPDIASTAHHDAHQKFAWLNQYDGIVAALGMN